jgi:hypothetical protein
MTIRKRGGQAKPPEERIIQFAIYPKLGHVEKLGRDNARLIAEKAIKNAIKQEIAKVKLNDNSEKKFSEKDMFDFAEYVFEYPDSCIYRNGKVKQELLEYFQTQTIKT